MSPWWASSGTDKNSFETCSSSDMDSEVPSMQLLSGVISSATNSFYDSDQSFLSAFQSPYNSSDDVEAGPATDPDLENIESVQNPEQFGEPSDVLIKVSDDDSGTYTSDRSSWSLVTKHTVKGCL